MRIATEILGVKGLKAHNNWSQQRLYTEWLQISMVSIFIWDDLTSYRFRNFKNRFVPSQPHTSYFKDASNTIELRCGTANPMICVLQFFKAQVYRSNFDLPKICHQFCETGAHSDCFPYHILPIFKGAISFHLGAGQICV